MSGTVISSTTGNLANRIGAHLRVRAMFPGGRAKNGEAITNGFKGMDNLIQSKENQKYIQERLNDKAKFYGYSLSQLCPNRLQRALMCFTDCFKSSEQLEKRAKAAERLAEDEANLRGLHSLSKWNSV